MDEKVKQFLDEAKAKEQKATEEAIAKEKKEKNDFLVSLGLIKEKKREYSDTLAPGFSLWDPEAKKYYADVSIAVDVTEEEYEEIKKYAKLQKQEGPAEDEDVLPYNNSAERTLNTINVIILVLALFGGFIWFFIGLSEGGFMAGLPGIILAIGYLIVWAFVKVYVNISNNLHKINYKLDKK